MKRHAANNALTGNRHKRLFHPAPWTGKDTLAPRAAMLAGPNCRTAKSAKTDPLSVNLSQLTASSRRFFAGMSEWVAFWVAFGRSMPRHALRSVLVLLHRTVLASTR
jgi:hypothetical protein